MPKPKNEGLKIDVVETTANEMRTITVMMTAPAKQFLFADLLRQRGAVEAIDAKLKQAMKEAVEAYLGEGEQLIADVVMTQKKSANGANVKGKPMTEENEARTLNGNGNGIQHEIPTYAEAGRVNGEERDVLSLQ